MQIILLDKVVNLGNLGDLVKVKDGFARNFLIPQKKARRATEAAIAAFQTQRAELERAAQEKLEAAQKQAVLFENFELTMAQKAGVDGRLFGSVTQLDIMSALQKRGYQIERGQIRMPEGHLKIVGIHTIQLILHTDVTCDIKISVVSE